jgi:uncharacterized membrane protein YedE/YeeE
MESLPLIGHWEIVNQWFLIAFVMSIFFGGIARKTQFCPLGGIADIMHSGNHGRFRMYFFAIGIAILGVTTLEALEIISVDSTRPPYRMSQFRWPGYVLGGFLFGLGMTMCRGCGMKNIINLGSGNMKAIIAILGMGSAAVLLLYVEGVFDDYFMSWMNPMIPDLAENGFDYQDLGTLAAATTGTDVATMRLIIGALLVLAFLGFAMNSTDFRNRLDNWIGGLLIGTIIVAAFYLSGGPLGETAQEASDFMDQPQNGMGVQSYTFIRPMGDLLYVISNPVWYLVTFGLVMFLGVGMGSIIISVITRQFSLQWFDSPQEGVRYLIGGVLVGIGGILGMGCTLGQGLAGTSTLALGSFLNLTSLIVGAIIGIKLQSTFMDDHEVPR